MNNLVEERDVIIVKLAMEGKSYPQIGKDMNVSRQRVQQICKKAGLVRRIDLSRPKISGSA